MIDLSSRYIINAPRVVHQIIDNEAVIIDFESGVYYSIDQAGAQVWALLNQNLSLSEMAASIERQYHRPTDEINGAITQFITQLLDEGLIRPGEGGPGVVSPPADLPPLSDASDFHPPVLQKYTDMQDLLLLDPIHEVDESGWPKPKPDENA